jgi:hypothetical protein
MNCSKFLKGFQYAWHRSFYFNRKHVGPARTHIPIHKYINKYIGRQLHRSPVEQLTAEQWVFYYLPVFMFIRPCLIVKFISFCEFHLVVINYIYFIVLHIVCVLELIINIKYSIIINQCLVSSITVAIITLLIIFIWLLWLGVMCLCYLYCS